MRARRTHSCCYPETPGSILELNAHIALHLARAAYRAAASDGLPKHAPSVILSRAAELRRFSPKCCYWPELTSLARHVQLGWSGDEWATGWSRTVIVNHRARSKVRLSR